MTTIKVGDKVEVLDPGLAMLRRLMPKAKPNNHGRVAEVCDNGEILVEFLIGTDDPKEHSQVVPYPAEMVRLLKANRRKATA